MSLHLHMIHWWKRGVLGCVKEFLCLAQLQPFAYTMLFVIAKLGSAGFSGSDCLGDCWVVSVRTIPKRVK